MKAYQLFIEAIFLSAVRENDISFFKSNWCEELSMFFDYGQKVCDKLKKLELSDSIQKCSSDDIPLYKIAYKTRISIKILRPLIKKLGIQIIPTKNKNKFGYLQSQQDLIKKSDLKKLFSELIKCGL